MSEKKYQGTLFYSVPLPGQVDEQRFCQRIGGVVYLISEEGLYFQVKTEEIDKLSQGVIGQIVTYGHEEGLSVAFASNDFGDVNKRWARDIQVN